MSGPAKARRVLVCDPIYREGLALLRTRAEVDEAGQIAGAGLDVWTNEPDANWRLAGRPRMVATPHLAASTEDAQRAAGLAAAEQIIARPT